MNMLPGPVRAALVAVPALFVAVFFAWPVAAIIRRGLSVDGVRDVFTDPGLRSVAWFTLWQAAPSTVLTLLLGLLPAFVLARYRFPGRALVLAFVTVPFVLPTVVVGTVFLAFLPESWDQTVAAIIIAHVYFNLAVVVRTVGTLWGQLDPRTEDAAGTLARPPPGPVACHPAAAPAGPAGGGGHHVPLHVHLVRRRPHPRRAPPSDHRGRDLAADDAGLRPRGRGRPRTRAARGRDAPHGLVEPVPGRAGRAAPAPPSRGRRDGRPASGSWCPRPSSASWPWCSCP